MLESIIHLDILVSDLVLLWRSPWLTTVMMFITKLGDDQIAYPLVALTILFLFVIRKIRDAIFFLITISFSALLNSQLKELVGRARPMEHQIVTETDFSFPSGHAMNSIVYFGLLAYLLISQIQSKAWRRFLTILAFSLSLLMGVSRVYLGVHYLSDIVCGYLLGAIILTIAIWVRKKVINETQVFENTQVVKK